MNLTFTNLVRFSLPGGVFIAVALLVYPQLQKWLAQSGDSKLFEAAMIFAVALLVGTMIQAIHRSALYMVIIRLIVFAVTNKDQPRRGTLCDQFKFWKILPNELHSYEKLFLFHKEKEFEHDWFRRWADQTHFMWASVWACGLARFSPSWFGLDPLRNFDLPLGLISLAIVIVAIIDDMRHFKLEREFRGDD